MRQMYVSAEFKDGSVIRCLRSDIAVCGIVAEFCCTQPPTYLNTNHVKVICQGHTYSGTVEECIKFMLSNTPSVVDFELQYDPPETLII